MKRKTYIVLATFLICAVFVLLALGCSPAKPATIHYVSRVAAVGPFINNYLRYLKSDAVSEEDIDEVMADYYMTKQDELEEHFRKVFTEVVPSESFYETPEFRALLDAPCPKDRFCGFSPEKGGLGTPGGNLETVDIPPGKAVALCSALNVDAIILTAMNWSAVLDEQSVQNQAPQSRALVHASYAIYDKTGERFFYLRTQNRGGLITEALDLTVVKVQLRKELETMFATFDRAFLPSMDDAVRKIRRAQAEANQASGKKTVLDK